MPRIFLRLPPSPPDWVKAPPTPWLRSLLCSPRFILCLALALLLLGASIAVWSHFSPPGTVPSEHSPSVYSYGVVVDAGSSSSKVQLYRWPPHTGNPASLLHIQPISDEYGLPLRKKIEPGIATYVNTPEEAYQSLVPLLDFALNHIPELKWSQTTLYVLCTAGMRFLGDVDQAAILGHLSHSIALNYPFYLPQDAIQVISGQMEGVYSWLTINYLMHRFDPEHHHLDTQRSSGDGGAVVGTVGSLDMGGASMQIAFEVPLSVDSPASQTVDINLGCGIQDSKHKHRVYIDTYLGFGANEALRLYRKLLFQNYRNRSSTQPVEDPCSPVGMDEPITQADQTLTLHGTGNFDSCRTALQPVLRGDASADCTDRTCKVTHSFKKPPVKYKHLEFFGTSEFFYTMRDTLRIAGQYRATSFNRTAREYCQTDWSVLEQRFREKLYPYADLHRLKSQCAKSSWMSLMLHEGLGFPPDTIQLRTAAEISQHNVHWSLGALLYLTRYLPLREIQQQALQQSGPQPLPYPSSLFSSLTESPVLLPCLVVTFVALTLLICRHRRPHTSASSYCGLYSSSSPVNDLLRSDSQISMSRNLSSRKLSMAIP